MTSPATMIRGIRLPLMLCCMVLPCLGCLGDLIPDRPDYSGFVDVTIPDGVLFDVPEVQADAASCKRNCYDRVCGPDECGGTCGTCPAGTVCSLDYSICLSEVSLKPTGSICGQYEGCGPLLEDPYTPGDYYTNPDWPRCLNHQCQGLVCDRSLCSAACQVRNDQIINGTAADVPDGIEDDTTDSDCPVAGGNGYSGPTMCVGRSSGIDGQLVGVCVPAASFMPCNPGDACPGVEECGYLRIGGLMETRCMAPIDGGLAPGEECGYDPISGQTSLCASSMCTESGCITPCISDADCVLQGEFCDRGVCDQTGFACVDDLDCSMLVCSDLEILDGFRVRGCSPRRCLGDTDCPGVGWYCDPVIETSLSGAQFASGMCRRINEDGAPVGTKCGPDDSGARTVCRNGELCVDGICSARCENDLDCFVHGDFRCVLRRETILSGYLSVMADFDVGYCRDTGYGPEGCGSDTDCGALACVPWVRAGENGREVTTTCMTQPDRALPIGGECGRYAFDSVCQSRYCFASDDFTGTPGWCSRVCSDDTDCPEYASIGDREYRWACSSLQIYGERTAGDTDDLYSSWCVPFDPESSLSDCSVDRYCAQPGQTCMWVPRFGGDSGDGRVDYLCVHEGDGAGDGGFCDPFKDGSDCASGICVPSASDEIGFCSHLCRDNEDCAMFGQLVTCEQSVVATGPDGNPLTTDICRMTGDCVICDDDNDCSETHRCVNISGSYWSRENRCVRLCSQDSDCYASPGTICQEVGNAFTASGNTVTACMTPTCG